MQLAVEDEDRARTHALPERQSLDFPLHLVNDLDTEFPAALDFDNVCGARRLYKKVNLASVPGIRTPSRVAVWGGRLDNRVSDVEKRPINRIQYLLFSLHYTIFYFTHATII